MRYLRSFLIFICFLCFANFLFGFSVQDVKVVISLTKSQINYTFSFESDEKILKLVLDRNISSLKLNGVSVNYRKVYDFGVNVYYIDLPKSGKFDLEVVYSYDILKECRNKSIVVFSEVMRSLPYVMTEKSDINVFTSVIIELPDGEELNVFVDGKIYTPSYGRVLIQQRKYNLPIVIGYLNLINADYNSFRVSIAFPKGNESVALSISSFINIARSLISSKFGFKLPEEIKVIYFPHSSFSETIEDTIVLSKIVESYGDYFSNLEKIENFILLVHEMLHLLFRKKISEDIIGIIEGFIQYVSIQVLSEVFGSSYIEDVVFNNYLSQVRFSFLSRSGNNDLSIVRYKKYPLVFRYISSIVGKVSLISFFSYLYSLGNINFDVFESAFRDVTGVSFGLFYPLFDDLPTLWNLEVTSSGSYVKVYSTAPTRVSTTMYVKTSEFETNLSIEIPKNSSLDFVFSSSIENVVLNPFRNFPEVFYYDNSIVNNVLPIVLKFVNEISYLLNTEDLTKLKSIIPSKSLQNKVYKYISNKRSIFGSGEIKVFLENIFRYNNQIVLEVIFASGVKYRQGFITISYGKSYYVSGFSVIGE